jgi:hypothetical protein
MTRGVLLLQIPFALAAAACGLSVAGLRAEGGPGGGDDGGPGMPGDDGSGGVSDAAATGDADGTDAAGGDAGGDDAPQTVDAPPPDTWVCTPIDAGVTGALALSSFATVGSAVWNENNDNRITLTNSNNNEAGAAWFPNKLPVVASYDLTWTLRVGPNNTAGDGITFAVLESTANLGVGDNGDGLGLRNLGGSPIGYAVAVDMYQKTTLELIAMPGYAVVASKDVPGAALNDGNDYAVDVSFRAPSTVTATIHAPSGAVTLTSSDPRLTTNAPAWLGFTGATGGGSDSHNEIVSINVSGACD